MNNSIKTIDYGDLPIAKDNTWLDMDTCIDIIEDCEGNFYEVRKTLNGDLVAYQNGTIFDI